MPTYEYVCVSCGVEFEAEGKISDPPVQFCALCGKERIQRDDGLVIEGPKRLISRKGPSDRGFIARLWDNDRG